jgi:hypothetical protein
MRTATRYQFFFSQTKDAQAAATLVLAETISQSTSTFSKHAEDLSPRIKTLGDMIELAARIIQRR